MRLNYILMRRSCCETAGNEEGDGAENAKGPIIESAGERWLRMSGRGRALTEHPRRSRSYKALLRIGQGHLAPRA